MMVTWRINKQAEERVRKGHPWVFAREIESTTKHHPAGHPIALLNIKGEFLGVGYGNPNSKILVRFLTLGRTPFDLNQKLKSLWQSKRALGFKSSFRWCFADSDGIPGLIIDRYLLDSVDGKSSQVFVVQKSTAGAEHLAPDLSELFKGFCEDPDLLKLGMLSWEQTSIIEKSDLSVRKLEGLEPKPARVEKVATGFSPEKESQILVGCNLEPLKLSVDFLNGQKTGFFLDQVWNAEQVSQFLLNQIRAQQALGIPVSKVKILDLCCYVGHGALA